MMGRKEAVAMKMTHGQRISEHNSPARSFAAPVEGAVDVEPLSGSRRIQVERAASITGLPGGNGDWREGDRTRYARVACGSLSGLESEIVHIEVSVLPGMPRFEVAGLADTSRKDAVRRVIGALKHHGFRPPAGTVIVNFQPGWIVKHGSSYDLPLALAVLSALDKTETIGKVAAFGELSLKGDVLPVRGALIRVEQLAAAGYKFVILPSANVHECKISTCSVIGVERLSEAMAAVRALAARKPGETEYALPGLFQREERSDNAADGVTKLPGCLEVSSHIVEIPSQALTVRALLAAAAGQHHIVMIGGAGCGKTRLAGFLAGVLPALGELERLEIMRVYSAAGLLLEMPHLRFDRPVRSPHFSISIPALCGGGKIPAPGELSLAHNGLLFLDELHEFSNKSLAALRQPLEEKKVYIRRHSRSATFPANCLLVGAANPCPCGNYLDQSVHTSCTCREHEIQSYRHKFAGPFADRIDIWLEMQRVETCELINVAQDGKLITAQSMRAQVEKARALQQARNGELNGKTLLNSMVTTGELVRLFRVEDHCVRASLRYAERLCLSARSYRKLLKVARTLADLDEEESVATRHIAEAAQFRRGEL